MGRVMIKPFKRHLSQEVWSHVQVFTWCCCYQASQHTCGNPPWIFTSHTTYLPLPAPWCKSPASRQAEPQSGSSIGKQWSAQPGSSPGAWAVYAAETPPPASRTLWQGKNHGQGGSQILGRCTNHMARVLQLHPGFWMGLEDGRDLGTVPGNKLWGGFTLWIWIKLWGVHSELHWFCHHPQQFNHSQLQQIMGQLYCYLEYNQSLTYLDTKNAELSLRQRTAQRFPRSHSFMKVNFRASQTTLVHTFLIKEAYSTSIGMDIWPRIQHSGNPQIHS